MTARCSMLWLVIVVVTTLAATGCGADGPSCSVRGAPSADLAACGTPAPGSACCDGYWFDPTRPATDYCGSFLPYCVCHDEAPAPYWGTIFVECNSWGLDAGVDGPPDAALPPDAAACALPQDAGVELGWAQWPVPPAGGDAGSPSYDTSNPDYVVDLTTGLGWQKVVPTGSYTLDQAKAYCAGLTLGGLGCWRLPSRVELMSIVDYGRHDPAIDPTAFPDTPSELFSTSSLAVGAAGVMWHVHFGVGAVGPSGGVNASYRVRCVR